MVKLLSGELDRRRYAELVVQLHGVYTVLEEAAAAMASDPVGGGFVDPALARHGALEADLASLLGPEWRQELHRSSATERYCERLRRVCFDWPGGFVAHHYVRYLGDLSGGQVIRRVLGRRYGLTDDELSFYRFDGLGDLGAYKASYRRRLDATPWDEPERQRFTAEVLEAYRLNAEVLEDLV